VYIGRHRNVTSEKFVGVIDEVKIYSQALDPAEFNLLPSGTTTGLMSIRSRLDGNLLRPNPVREAPAVFHVEGTDIAYISIDIYDLSGKRVFTSGWRGGNTVEWQLRNDEGELLANGIYLYIVQVKTTDNEERRSSVRKLAVLR